MRDVFDFGHKENINDNYCGGIQNTTIWGDKYRPVNLQLGIHQNIENYGYGIDYLYRVRGGGGKTIVQNKAYVASDDYLRYYDVNNILYKPTPIKELSKQIGVSGWITDGAWSGGGERHSLTCHYFILDNSIIEVYSSLYGDNGHMSTPQLNVIDTFERISDESFLINGTLNNISLNSSLEIQYISWNNADHGKGYASVYLFNKTIDEYQIKIVSYDDDEQCNTPKVGMMSYIKKL